MAEGVEPLEITLHRMALASLLIFIFSKIKKNKLVVLNFNELKELLLVGLIAALHFGCFVMSLSYTLVSHSLALCYTAPIFAMLFSNFLLNENINKYQILAIIISSFGVLILSKFEPTFNNKMIYGDILALISGISLGLYQTLSRMYKEKYDVLKYKANAYLFASIYLFVILIVLRILNENRFLSAYSFKSVLGIILSAVVCTLIGHVFINLALRNVKTTYVSIISTQEVTGGIIFAMIFLDEKLSLITLIGITLSLIGSIIVILAKEKN